MEQKIGQPNIRRELVTLLAVGVLGALGSWYVGTQVLEAIEGDTADLPVAGAVIEPVVGIFVLWAAYSVALHVLGNVFGGRGPVRRLLKTVPWALIPIGIGNLVRTAATYLVYQGIDVPTVISEARLSPVEAVYAAGTGEPLFVAATVLLILTVLWSGYLMVVAVEQAKEIPRQQAIKAAAIPVGVHVLYLVWELLGGVGVL